MNTYKKLGLTTTPISDPAYPPALKEIHNPPRQLYTKGRSIGDLVTENSVAIVGSRAADVAGCQFTQKLAKDLTAGGITVVSGLALGIDSAAHEGAIKGGGAFPTVAVLGNGLASVYPKRNARLAQQILEVGGTLLSTFEPDEPPYPSNFLNRNRIIAGLSQAVIVVQAARRSGALSTARHALESGREVMVVPGGVNDKRYSGTLELLRNGATPIRSAQDVIQDLFGGEVPRSRVEMGEQSISLARGTFEQRVMALLRRAGEISFDTLSLELDESKQLRDLLLELEDSGDVERLPGNRFRLSE